jgi:hypothetical protein
VSKQKDPFVNKRMTTMEVNGLKCAFHMPKAVKRRKNKDGSEYIAGLPPYAGRVAYAVDEYPASPDTWMHGSAKASSYFVPIVPERGMWLDFNGNNFHTHHVAVVVSVQGINPLTGMKSDPIRLEQYREKCPKHEKEFQQDLLCPDCKYKWHPQNYLSSNTGNPFWIDGFRTEDGTIRQWWFTEEECKGIAAQLIGKDRVFAIGIAFYLSKEPKPAPRIMYTWADSYPNYTWHNYLGSNNVLDNYSDYCSGEIHVYHSNSIDTNSAETYTCSTSSVNNLSKGVPTAKSPKISKRRLRSAGPSGQAMRSVKADVEKSLKQIEIGAGAKIRQKFNPDPENLDFWQPEPAGFIYINYCDVTTAQKILEAGKHQEQEEGFLSGLEIKD